MNQKEFKEKIAALPEKDDDLPIMIFYANGPYEDDMYEYEIQSTEELNRTVFIELRNR